MSDEQLPQGPGIGVFFTVLYCSSVVTSSCLVVSYDIIGLNASSVLIQTQNFNLATGVWVARAVQFF